MKLRAAMRHQANALKWARPLPAIPLYLQMRLGKSLIFIRWAKQWLERLPGAKVLIVAPLPVVDTWIDELALEGIEGIPIVGAKRHQLLLQNEHCDWFVTNYETLRAKGGKPSDIAQLPWTIVGLDESTRIRNPQAQITKVLNDYVGPRAQCRAVMSGLPNPEDPLDYCEQFRFLYGEFMGFDSYWSARHRLYQAGKNDWEWFPKLGTIKQIKDYVHQHAFVLTRKQAGIGSKVVSERRYVELPKKIRKHYDQLEEEFFLGDEETKYAFVKNMWLARLAGGRPDQKKYQSNHKLEELAYLLSTELKKEKVVVWFRFNTELMDAAYLLEDAGIPCECIHGAVKRADRKERIDRVKTGRSRILLCQGKTGLFGLNFAFCDTMIYYSRWYDWEVNAQTRDRIIDPRKKKTVLQLDLLTKDTVDEDVYDAVLMKAARAAVFTSLIKKNMIKRIARRVA